MILNVENKVKILPFRMEVDWKELVTVWSEDELDLKSSDFYLISLENGDQFVLDCNLELPLFINEVYKKVKVLDLFNGFQPTNITSEESKPGKYENKKIEIFKYQSDKGTGLKIKENKVLTNLFVDFEFSQETFKSIKKYSVENGVIIYDMIKKVILINDYLVLIPIEKKEKQSSSFLELNQKELSDKLFMLGEGIKLIDNVILKEDLLKIAQSIK